MATHVAIVGAYGSAGVAAAERLAEDPDIELTLVDDGEPGGGLCILRGCMPSKEVLSAAEHRFVARHDDRLSGPLPDVDLESVIERKDDHTANFAAHRRAAVERLAERDDVTFLHDTARFVDDGRLAVGDRTIEPDYVVIATGSTVDLPSLPGIGDVDVLTSADVLDRSEFGESGVVMGFGYVGLELVPYLSEAAGMDLTVVEHDARPLDEGDEPFGDALLEYYREAFDIDVLTDTHEKRVEATENAGVRLHVDREGREEAIEADQLFAFTRSRSTGSGSDRRLLIRDRNGSGRRCRRARTTACSSPATPTAGSRFSTSRRSKDSRRLRTSGVTATAIRSSSTRTSTTTSSFRDWAYSLSPASATRRRRPTLPESSISPSLPRRKATACSKPKTSPRGSPVSSSGRTGPFSGTRGYTTTPT